MRHLLDHEEEMVYALQAMQEETQGSALAEIYAEYCGTTECLELVKFFEEAAKTLRELADE